MAADTAANLTDANQPELLTVRTTARRLTISLAATYELIRSGKLPYYRIGGAIRVAVADLDRFLAGCRSVPPESRRAVPTAPRRKPLKHINL